MRKFAVVACALIPAMSAFAYYGGYDYFVRKDEMSGWEIFAIVVMIVYIILSIVILVRWWKMTADVKQIREHITPSNSKLTYLVAIGEEEHAQKAALKILVDALYGIYTDQYNFDKAQAMNKEIEDKLPKIQRLGLTMPDYVTSGEKFIDYMNDLTGRKVPYSRS